MPPIKRFQEPLPPKKSKVQAREEELIKFRTEIQQILDDARQHLFNLQRALNAVHDTLLG